MKVHFHPAALGLVIFFICQSGICASLGEHPRLYFNSQDLPRLRADRFHGTRKLIWKNIAHSAEWCLTREPRKEWLAPVSPDPHYENLYDRFYAIMGDLAITEHLSFAYALSGDPRYGEAARRWVLASCRAWKSEAQERPDSGKAYAVSRLLKGVAVGYDAVFDRLNEGERKEIRETLVGMGEKYFQEWFNTPSISGPGYYTHHAIVEWGSFGVLALALLGEEPQAQQWLEATIRKFEQELLPNGLAPDGAQTEGATFWASTMHYRLFFMDPLRRMTGKDLFAAFKSQMNADLALASIACRKRPGLDEHNANVVLEPAYGQLDYYSPVLLALAREYRRPIFQYLAQWDETMGSLQHTRYITPHGEELLFELGGYAYVWCDDSVSGSPSESKLSWLFPSVNEAYARLSWKPGGLLVGIRNGELVVHAGKEAILVEPGISTNLPASSISQKANLQLTDDGRVAIIQFQNTNSLLRVELDRKTEKLAIQRVSLQHNIRFWSQGKPKLVHNKLKFRSGATLSVTQGRISDVSENAHATAVSVGNGLLPLNDPLKRAYPVVCFEPDMTGKVSFWIR